MKLFYLTLLSVLSLFEYSHPEATDSANCSLGTEYIIHSDSELSSYTRYSATKAWRSNLNIEIQANSTVLLQGEKIDFSTKDDLQAYIQTSEELGDTFNVHLLVHNTAPSGEIQKLICILSDLHSSFNKIPQFNIYILN